jgi:hypothetical protein
MDERTNSDMSETSTSDTPSTASLAQLPLDELKAHAKSLGIGFSRDAQDGEILRLIRERRELLLDLNRQALLDICVWARRPVQKSAGKDALAREIASINMMRFDGLSDQGLAALCRLRSLEVDPGADRTSMIRTLKKAEPLGKYIKRKRRRLMGSLINKLVSTPASEPDGDKEEYQFLPEDDRSLKIQIEEEGLVGGITRKIKGVADDYVREKLDEIETRIDRKLDEIDTRLGEWRDREIRNRLRIIKITLLASIVVAVLSLGYDYVKRLTVQESAAQEVAGQTSAETP